MEPGYRDLQHAARRPFAPRRQPERRQVRKGKSRCHRLLLRITSSLQETAASEPERLDFRTQLPEVGERIPNGKGPTREDIQEQGNTRTAQEQKLVIDRQSYVIHATQGAILGQNLKLKY